MKKTTLNVLTTVLGLQLLSSAFAQQTLVHYWNFNNNSSEMNLLTPVNPLSHSGSISYTTGATTVLAYENGTGQDFSVQNLNARGGDAAGTHLRFNDPIGGSLIFGLPTLGFENPVVKFTTRRSGQGAGTQTWSYSLDGTTFTIFQTIQPVDGAPTLQTLDFSSIDLADNNANFTLKVEFSQGTGGVSGNNRFDNFTLDAYVLGTTPTDPGSSNNDPATIQFAQNFMVGTEGQSALEIVLNVANPAVGSVDVVVKGAPFSTADGNDFTFATQTVVLNAESTSYTLNFPIVDDQEEEQQAEYVVLSLENAVGATITGNSFLTIYIKDNDRLAPIPTEEITLEYIGSFDPSGSANRSTEIVVHEPASQRLFVTSGVEGLLDIIDFSNPLNPEVIHTIDMSTYGTLTSVAIYDGILAVASPNTDDQQDGSVVFFDRDGNFLKQVTVGTLPDNISFSPDGSLVLTANEGQPNADYSNDPEGSVSIIDLTNGIENLTQADVTTLYFTSFNQDEAALIASGIRKTKSTSTLSQDLEPEYIAITADSQKAYVTLQENNAIGEIDLVTKSITSIWAMGTKDMSAVGNGFDASDNNGEILIANWPVQSYYIPDAVATYSVNGTNYLITANEGDEKEYGTFEERVAVSSGSYNLDPQTYPNASVLKQAYNLGRFRATNLNGDTNNDGVFEQIHSVGARSFSIFNADTKSIVYDSGDDFEMYTAQHYASIFNADHESNGAKARSRSKGPEPEGVTVATIHGQTFAFIGLERIGGVMVYNVTDPENPTFVDYKNSRSTSAYEGDFGAEGLIFIDAANSPTNKPYVIIANEVSGTLTIYEVNTNSLALNKGEESKTTFNVFPNPVGDPVLYFNRMADVEVYSITGILLEEKKQSLTLNVSNYAAGTYIIKTADGSIQKFIKQ